MMFDDAPRPPDDEGPRLAGWANRPPDDEGPRMARQRRARGGGKGPTPPGDWGDSAEAGEWRSLKNMLDRGAEFDDNLHKRFGELNKQFERYVGGQGPTPAGGAGPAPPAGPQGGQGGGDQTGAASELRSAAQQLSESAQQLAEAARQLAQHGGGGGKGAGGKDPFGGAGDAEGAGEEVGGLEEVEIAAAFV